MILNLELEGPRHGNALSPCAPFQCWHFISPCPLQICPAPPRPALRCSAPSLPLRATGPEQRQHHLSLTTKDHTRNVQVFDKFSVSFSVLFLPLELSLSHKRMCSHMEEIICSLYEQKARQRATFKVTRSNATGLIFFSFSFFSPFSFVSTGGYTIMSAAR